MAEPPAPTLPQPKADSLLGMCSVSHTFPRSLPTPAPFSSFTGGIFFLCFLFVPVPFEAVADVHQNSCCEILK